MVVSDIARAMELSSTQMRMARRMRERKEEGGREGGKKAPAEKLLYSAI